MLEIRVMNGRALFPTETEGARNADCADSVKAIGVLHNRQLGCHLDVSTKFCFETDTLYNCNNFDSTRRIELWAHCPEKIENTLLS